MSRTIGILCGLRPCRAAACAGVFRNGVILSVLAISVLTMDAAGAAESERTFEFENFGQVAALFDELGYTQEAWQQGIREVPRLIVVEVPSRWRNEVAPTLVVADKKRIFFRMLGPLLLIANERINKDRTRLMAFMERRQSGGAIEDAERIWVEALAARYNVALSEPYSAELLATLSGRVDIVPPSLAMAQSAEESGWGTSRFADLGNALFGQWTWSGGIEPLNKRQDKGSYGIARFDTPLDSVEAYMRNLNTHPAYQTLRERRAAMRAAGARPDGFELAKTLTRYSERGEDYVHSLHAIMRVNKLQPADDAFLSPGPPLFLVPIDRELD